MGPSTMHDAFSRTARLCLLIAAGMALVAAPAWCEDDDDNETVVEAETVPFKAEHQAATYAGYRFITPVDAPTAVAPYLRRKSGMTGGLSLGVVDGDLKLSAEGQFLHADDYHTGLVLDYAGLYRLRLDTATLWHNLFRLPLPNGWDQPFDTMTPLNQETVHEYGIRTNISKVDNRIKFGSLPVHLTLGYWELSSRGITQARFSDHAFDGTPANIISQSVRVDSTTREASLGLDAYLGPVSAAYSFVLRDFSNSAPDPRYAGYAPRDGFAGGSLPHDAVADSRTVTNTLSVFGDLSGGLTTHALYSVTRRESRDDRGDALPAGRPADTLQTVAGDVSYTPAESLTLALKYRRLEISRETPVALYSTAYQLPAVPSPVFTATPGLLLVRPSSDSTRDTVSLSASWRPMPKTVYRLEYKAELENRDNLPDQQNLAALHSDRRLTNTATGSFLWRPFNAVRFNAVYSYATCDNPAYLASFGERHTGQTLISYHANGKWGLTANYLGRYESGSNAYQTTRLPRESSSSTVGSSFWFNPVERVTLTAGYALNQIRIDQQSLVSDQFPSPLLFALAHVYRSRAHSYNLDGVFAARDDLDLSFSFQQTFSDTRYNARDNSTNPALSAGGIGDATRLVSTETGLTARADWRLNRHLGCSFAYTFRNLTSDQPLHDGAAHETMLSLTGRW